MPIGKDKMNLPERFSFSQQNLQDYVDCPYRFLLRHILQVEWPAVESEPVLLNEMRMELGQRYHRLVQQYFAGIPAESLTESIELPELLEWWKAFLDLKIQTVPGEKFAEKLFSVPFEGSRLMAKIDLLLVQGDNQYRIYDWKTGAVQPTYQNLSRKLQTIVYPYVLTAFLTQNSAEVENFPEIEMIYWYPASPNNPLQFIYSPQKFSQDQRYLSNIVQQIKNAGREDFLKTSEEKKCRYCRYRSLCDRGIEAGTLSEEASTLEGEDLFDLNFDDFQDFA
ncbi:MAG: PD-(D/E)XK nuclease family protein [Anaerolineaceae bacterium]|nr:PD-(D/E)XK nuclease family protein [Anaerolineaceae bacterium]